VAEACEREFLEETGLQVRVRRFVGVYSHPDQLTLYSETDKFQIVALHFEAEARGGELRLSDETSDFGYFTMKEIKTLEMLGRHKERIVDTLANQKEAFIR
jgi:ADP-ribose pyrophosphatase YjhB (NUDIX family)